MAIKNLASGTLAESVSASTTTLLVYVGNGSSSTIQGVWPTPPFYATIMPSNPTAGVANSLDSEIVRVTAVGHDQVGNTALTVVRGQKGSNAQAFAEGAIVTNANYAEEAVLLGDEETAETPTPWIESDMIDWDDMVQAGSSATPSSHRVDLGKFHIFMGYSGGAAGGGQTLSIDLPSDWVANATMYNSIVQAKTYFSQSADTTFGAYWFQNGKANIYQISGNANYGNPTQIICFGWW